MDRRTFLGTLAAAPIVPPLCIDTHIHLFDTARPQGVPWPDKGNATLYQPALPARLRRLAVPHGVTGAIHIECSPWVEDNQWVLDVAGRDPFLLGVIGNLEPGRPEFGGQLERFRKNPLFLGVRCGNLWGRNLMAESAKPEFVAGLKVLAGAGLTMDTANPSEELLRAVVRVTDAVPGLRVVVDHLPQLDPAGLDGVLKELAQRPQVYVKMSSVLRRSGGRVPVDVRFYRERLEGLVELFGEGRLLFGSDWPNSDQWGTYSEVFEVVRAFWGGRSEVANRRFFGENALAAYGLKVRRRG